jgi:23S rRNA (cytidine1920-2'-O)/16S rRNA (cytidine1409-2'-O)-methyltransferase
MPKIRADILMVERGLAESRSRAQAAIMSGKVFSGERRIDKAGDTLNDDAPLTLREPDHPWVSRGGLKLVEALDHFGIDPAGLRCLDVGASTGGFTDVLLSRGAAAVIAVDVGRGQLAWKLREDTRVTVMEGVNARHLTDTEIPEPVELIVCDASFIGLDKVLPAPMALAAPGARLVALIKPQFQLERNAIGKGGIVRDPARHREACDAVTRWLNAQPGWTVIGVTDSPISGTKGNREFLVAAERSAADADGDYCTTR